MQVRCKLTCKGAISLYRCAFWPSNENNTETNLGCEAKQVRTVFNRLSKVVSHLLWLRFAILCDLVGKIHATFSTNDFPCTVIPECSFFFLPYCGPVFIETKSKVVILYSVGWLGNNPARLPSTQPGPSAADPGWIPARPRQVTAKRLVPPSRGSGTRAQNRYIKKIM